MDKNCIKHNKIKNNRNKENKNDDDNEPINNFKLKYTFVCPWIRCQQGIK